MSPLRLEVFETENAGGGAETVVTDLAALEEAKLAAYEQGYSAGWEDAGAASAADQTRIRADLANSIQGLSFTYHEARTHVLQAVEPLVTRVLCRLLPQIAAKSLPQRVVEEMRPFLRDMAETPMQLVLNPLARPAIEALLGESADLPVQLVDEPSLGEGQVYLKLGDSELRVDLAEAALRLSRLIDNFFALQNKDTPHG
jgi:flagellar biosynthesis/type III secretory pathway protein FliH